MQGVCYNIQGAVKCLCYYGFTGQSCQTALDGSSYPCSSNPCHIGKCVTVYQTSTGLSYICMCPNTTINQECYNTAANRPTQSCSGGCFNNRCKNNAICYGYYAYNAYYCKCPYGTTGKNCEQTYIPPCSTVNYCQNNGNCTTNFNGQEYKCLCQYPFTGRRCEIELACASSPCQNNNSCTNINDGQSYQCHCSNKFTGKNCQIRDYCNSNPCQNKGICSNSPNNYTCQCVYPFGGSSCQIRNPQVGDVRLLTENETNAGELQVYINKDWGYVCFNDVLAGNLADVVCHQLGYNRAEYFTEVQNPGPYLLPSLQCNTTLSTLFECNGNIDFGTNFNCSTSARYFIRCEAASNHCVPSGNNICTQQNKICKALNSGFVCTCREGYTGVNCKTPIISPWKDGTIRIYDYEHEIKSTELSYRAVGALEIFHLGVWGSISANNPSVVADIACRQLGYTVGYQRHHIENSSPSPFIKYWINNIYCKGAETTIRQCFFQFGTNTTMPKARYDVKCFNVTCNPNTCQNNATCTSTKLVVNGLVSEKDECKCTFGYYGDVCQHIDFCATLKPCQNQGQCALVAFTSYDCRCPNYFFGRHCQIGKLSNGSSLIINGSINSNAINFGRIDVVIGRSEIVPLCSNKFTINDAHVICQHAGYAGAVSKIDGSIFGKDKVKYGLANMKCTGFEKSLSQCSGYNSYVTNCNNSYAGVICSTNKPCTSNPCQNGGTCINMFFGFQCKCGINYFGRTCVSVSEASGSIRLVGQSENSMQGRPQIFINNLWINICTPINAYHNMRAICSKMGYIFATASKADTQNYRGSASYKLQCNGKEADIKECKYTLVKNSTHTYCKQDILITCTGYSRDGVIRFMGNPGLGSYFQIYCNGMWGRYCGEGKEIESVLRMACGVAGYETFEKYDLDSIDPKEHNYGPMLLWNAFCSTNATDLNQCNSLGWYNIPDSCKASNKTVYLTCKIQPVSGTIKFDVTQISFITDYKGEILIFHNGVWGGFCYDNFTKQVGEVICRQLGFHRYVWHTCCFGGRESFAKVWITGMRCSGQESNITQCDISYGPDTSKCRGATILTCEKKNPKDFSCIHGEVVHSDQGRRCDCDPGYFGKHCEYMALCHWKPCKNSGTCIDKFRNVSDIYKATYYECHCSNPYYGKQCHLGPAKDGSINTVIPYFQPEQYYAGRIKIYLQGIWYSFCRQHFSLNAANVICQQQGYGKAISFSTNYPIGQPDALMTNLRCTGYESSILECLYKLNPISQNAACLPKDYVGINCSTTYDKCRGIPCQNGATCRTFWFGFKCQCPQYYTGLLCETYIGPALEGDLRLINGATLNEGRVEIFHNMKWSTVCGNTITKQEGKALCHQLNLIFEGFTYHAVFGKGHASVPILSLNCSNDKTKIKNCNLSPISSAARCNHNDDVGIICITKACVPNPCRNGAVCYPNILDYYCHCVNGYSGKNCSEAAEGTLRLVNGTGFNSGNLEIYHDNVWGAICSRDFADASGLSVCQELGFINEENFYCCSEFGQHNGTFWLHNIRCNDEDKKLIDCKFDSYNTMCSPSQVVGLRCRYGFCDSFPCQNGGHCEYIYHLGIRKGTCDCRRGFTGKLCEKIDHPKQITCADNPCGPGSTCLDLALGYKCYCSDRYYGKNCKKEIINGIVRFYSPYGVDNIRSGTVQIYFNGTWGTICSKSIFSRTSARVICKMLNYEVVQDVKTNSFFGSAPGRILFSNVQCTGNETSILDCQLASIIPKDCNSNTLVGVTCQKNPCSTSPTPCGLNGFCRMIATKPFYKCRCNSGQAGYNCDREFNACDRHPCATQAGGRAVCKFVNGFATCQCPEDYSGYNCLFYSRLIGIRLVAGNKYNIGTVEIYKGNKWSRICSQNWQFSHARVACRQLGFMDAQLRTQCCSNLEDPLISKVMSGINCTGNEPNLNDCSQNHVESNISSCSKSAAIYCIDSPLDSNLSNLTSLSASYKCESDINPCLSSPCGRVSATCVNVLKPFRGYACLCENGYWNGYQCVNDVVLTTVTLKASTNTVAIGQRLLLECVAYAIPLPKISWLKDGQIIINSWIKVIKNDTVSVKNGSRSTLEIKSITLGDNGNYSCIAKDEVFDRIVQSNQEAIGFTCSPAYCSNRGNCTITGGKFVCSNCTFGYGGSYCNTLLPYVPLRSAQLQTNAILYRQYESIIIQCSIIAYPVPIVLWMKNNSVIRQENNVSMSKMTNDNNYYELKSTLIIRSASILDAGSYACHVKDTHFNKTIKSDSINIDVGITLESVQIQANTSNYFFGLPLSIECKARSYPPSNVTWIKNNLPVKPRNNSYIIIANDPAKYLATSILLINQLSTEDNGKYQCIANDTFNHNLLETTPWIIKVTCPPNFCRHGGHCSISGSSLICSCSADYTGSFCETIIPNIPANNVRLISNSTLFKVDSYVSLSCQVIARPRPIFTWIKDNIPIRLKNHTEIDTKDSSSKNTYISILYFNPLMLGDNGIYQCLVNDTVNNKFIQSATMNISFTCSAGYCSYAGKCKILSYNRPSCSCNNGYEGNHCQKIFSGLSSKHLHDITGSYIGIATGVIAACLLVGVIIIYFNKYRKGQKFGCTWSFRSQNTSSGGLTQLDLKVLVDNDHATLDE
ncbi:Deleted in malignant brain tumors 1 protein [Trichoplax sp. H2]|nr:Deleted in malignant brain tumors 1 protein [Trichoplax sp. H2]|eukprot:RDD38528.1 Deleted in malignant brain tumors 1 protein [Trichoplax sp. H2]